MDKKRNSVLIVDDSTLNIAALTNILAPEYQLYVEKDGGASIEAAKKLTPDLILLDVIMPGMDGFEVITRLKANTVTQDIPVIFITGLDSNADEEKGFVLGAADYINKPFSPAVVKLRVRNQIQIVNQIRTIHKQSITDELTGLGNRRFFYTHLEQEWNHAKRNGASFSFMMMDIDRFKLYNDTHGHLQGDVALKNTAKTIKESLSRTIDKAARWGGEEFAVILPDTSVDGAMKVAERIRKNVERNPLPLPDGGTNNVTVSIGLNAIKPQGQDIHLKTFISGADKALYHAKATGRNRVIVYEDVIEEEQRLMRG